MADLKVSPCPFCNGRALRYHEDQFAGCYFVGIRCDECNARGPLVTVYAPDYDESKRRGLLREKAAAAWNKQLQVKGARNELCILCGKYRFAHQGSCDGCRWQDMECCDVS